MAKSQIERVSDLQAFIREQGLGAKVVTVPESRLSVSEDAASIDQATLYEQLVTVPQIAEVSRDLYASGFYSQAVDEAFKVVEVCIQERAGLSAPTALALARTAFDPNEPKLAWTSLSSQSERDEQAGYYQIYSGSFGGIAGPVRSEIGWISDPDIALDCILLAQHLLRKLMATSRVTGPKASEF
jgi:uncharacterized protein (TIGR02391 family)